MQFDFRFLLEFLLHSIFQIFGALQKIHKCETKTGILHASQLKYKYTKQLKEKRE